MIKCLVTGTDQLFSLKEHAALHEKITESPITSGLVTML